MTDKIYQLNREFFSDVEWYDIISCQLELPPKEIVINEDRTINPEYIEYFNYEFINLIHNKVCISNYYVLCEFLLHNIKNDMFNEAIHLFIDENQYQNFVFQGDDNGLGFIINIYNDEWDCIIKRKKTLFEDYNE